MERLTASISVSRQERNGVVLLHVQEMLGDRTFAQNSSKTYVLDSEEAKELERGLWNAGFGRFLGEESECWHMETKGGRPPRF